MVGEQPALQNVEHLRAFVFPIHDAIWVQTMMPVLNVLMLSCQRRTGIDQPKYVAEFMKPDGLLGQRAKLRT